MGVGGSKSKSTAEMVSELVAETMYKNQMQIGQAVAIQQTIDVSGEYNVVKDVVMRQAIQLNADAFQNTQNLTKMQTQVENAIQQFAKTSSQALLSMLEKQEAENNLYLRNSVRNSVTSETMQNIAQTINAAQGISVSGKHNIVTNVTMEQLQDIYVSAAQSALNDTQLIQDIKNKTKQEAVAESLNPIATIVDAILKPISNLTGGTNGQIFIVLIIIAAAIAFYIVDPLGLFGSGGFLGGHENEQYDMSDYIVDVV